MCSGVFSVPTSQKMTALHVVWLLYLGLYTVTSAPIEPLSMYDAIEEKCPNVTSVPTFKTQPLFKTCKDWKNISEINELSDKNAAKIRCLLYYQTFTQYCTQTQSINIVGSLELNYDLKTICDYVKSIDHKNLSTIFAKEDNCERICTDEVGLTHSVCKISYYFATLGMKPQAKLPPKTQNASDSVLPAQPLNVKPAPPTPKAQTPKEVGQETQKTPEKTATPPKTDKPAQPKAKVPVIPDPKPAKPQAEQEAEVQIVPKESKTADTPNLAAQNEKLGQIEPNPKPENQQDMENIGFNDEEEQQPPEDDDNSVEHSPVVNNFPKPNKIDESEPINNSTEMDGDSYFFTYFMVLCVLFIAGYVCYHNKQKILALILEGRRGKRQYRGRRPNSANYHKLDSNLEEAISSSCKKNTNNVIY